MKQTIKAQYDELARYGELFEQTNCYGGVCCVIDDNGEWILYKVSESPYSEYAKRWQRIKYTRPDKNGESKPYFLICGKRHYLDNFRYCG